MEKSNASAATVFSPPDNWSIFLTDPIIITLERHNFESNNDLN